MTLADYQWSFNGLTVGPGTGYRITSIDGLRTMPTTTSGDSPRLRRSGVFANGEVVGPRTITVGLVVQGTSVADFEAKLLALETATVPIRPGASAPPFLFKQPGQIQCRFLAARPTKRAQPQEPSYIKLWQKVNLQFTCPDPARYDDVLTTTVITPTGAIVNAGNVESFPVITLTSPVSPVGIANTANGAILVLVGSIPNPCIVDTDKMTVVDGSGVNRFDVVDLSAGGFPYLSPGTNNLTVSGAASSWAWRSAWL